MPKKQSGHSERGPFEVRFELQLTKYWASLLEWSLLTRLCQKHWIN